MTTKPKLLDVVRLTELIPGQSVPVGAIGTIVEAFTTPNEAYEIEFCDENGRTLAQVALLPSQFAIVQ